MCYRWFVMGCLVSAPMAVTLCAEPGAHIAHEGKEASIPTLMQPGQSAFAALTEVVALLDADPATDWERVDITRLRDHLVDMDEVLMRSHATLKEVDGAIRLSYVGTGRTLEAIRRMIPAHARMLNGYRGWQSTAVSGDNVVIWTLTAPSDAERARIRALGAFGLLTLGSHHGPHHLAMARGRLLTH